MSVTGFMTHTIVIQVSSVVKDETNQRQKTWATESTVKGLINALSGRDQYTSARRSIWADYALYVPTSTTITENNLVVCEGRTYEVVFVSDPMQMKMFTKVYLKELR